MPSASDRFKIVTAPIQPGNCRVCGVVFGQRPLLDTGFDYDFCSRPHYDVDEVDRELVDMNNQGAVYFCDQCVIAMAQLFECLTPKQSADITRQIADLENESIDLKKKILGLEGIINGYQLLNSVDPDTASSVSRIINGESFEKSASEATSGVSL